MKKLIKNAEAVGYDITDFNQLGATRKGKFKTFRMSFSENDTENDFQSSKLLDFDENIKDNKDLENQFLNIYKSCVFNYINSIESCELKKDNEKLSCKHIKDGCKKIICCYECELENFIIKKQFLYQYETEIFIMFIQNLIKKI